MPGRGGNSNAPKKLPSLLDVEESGGGGEMVAESEAARNSSWNGWSGAAAVGEDVGGGNIGVGVTGVIAGDREPV